MTESPDAVLLYVPLMKELGMSWNEIKNTSHRELQGLLGAYYEHKRFHSMDGYDDKDVQQMAQNKPQIRRQYHDYLETRRKYEMMVGKKRKSIGFGGIR